MEWGLFGGVIAWCAALCWFDVRERRLPDVLTLPAAAIALLWAAWSVFDGAPAPLLGAALWTTVNGMAFVCRGMGAGDVKVAPALGVVSATVAGIAGVLVSMVAAQVITIVWAAALRDRTVPHGPAMCLAVLGTVLSTSVR
ncbi:prepilin peptidase [Tsukamurella sputi]|uniref:Prepilin peptidase n=1 Tax=Tsukamurella sputi TaxID=2591848 RepID=A0A5C5RQW8_9ACTN|nr:A24 family peptidase [Tsukamurella sputi]TWS24928.1 prepilin peptidase [Tsukamurella sputi]